MNADHLAAAVGAEAHGELKQALDRIRHCLEQLSDEQVWSRSGPEMNSIGNLLLHLAGNVRQWLIAGLTGSAHQRQRAAEFAETGPISKAELLRRLEGTVSEAGEVLARQTASGLLEQRRIQGFTVTGLEAIFSSVPHFRGHTQEIIHMTRLQLGKAYRFAWEPTSPEQGAPA
jgi:hypothetical protein